MFDDYLNDRNQEVLTNGNSLSQKPVSAGVRQGSVLGPLLFLIYINNISDELTGLARPFANDTSIIVRRICEKIMHFMIKA